MSMPDRPSRRSGLHLFEEHFAAIETTIRKVSARHRLGRADRQDLYGEVMLRLALDDFRVLREFRARGRIEPYLAVVVRRVLLDLRIRERGRWRPCAEARRLGPVAERLDRHLNRDGLAVEEAVLATLQGSAGVHREQLEGWLARIPRRPRRRIVSMDDLAQPLPSRERAESRVEAAEQRRLLAVAGRVLCATLGRVSPEDRRLLTLRFADGWSVRHIARHRDIPAHRLYRRFRRLLRFLRQALDEADLAWSDLARALEDGVDLFELEW